MKLMMVIIVALISQSFSQGFDDVPKAAKSKIGAPNQHFSNQPSQVPVIKLQSIQLMANSAGVLNPPRFIYKGTVDPAAAGLVADTTTFNALINGASLSSVSPDDGGQFYVSQRLNINLSTMLVSSNANVESPMYEIRFGSDNAGLAVDIFSTNRIYKVPFTAWDLGENPNDPSDDIQMLVANFSSDGDSTRWGIREIASQWTLNPAKQSDAIYLFYPATSYDSLQAAFNRQEASGKSDPRIFSLFGARVVHRITINSLDANPLTTVNASNGLRRPRAGTIIRWTFQIEPHAPTFMTADLYGVVGRHLTFKPVKGFPKPDISLISTPIGMTLEAKSGALHWTPSPGQDGFNSIVLQASNTQGSLQKVYTMWVDAHPWEHKELNNNNTELSVYNNGVVGQTGDGNVPLGSGFRFKGINGLYQGHIIIARSATQVSGYLSTGTNSEFATVGPVTSVTGPIDGFERALKTVFNDQRSSFPIGVRVTLTSYTKSSVPDDNYVILDYEISNTTAIAKTGIYVGLAMDWDVGADHNKNLGGYDAGRKLSYMFEDSGKTNNKFYGAAVLLGKISGHTYNVPYYFSPNDYDSQYYYAMQSIQNPPTSSGDYRPMISVGPYDILAGGNIRIVFAVLGGDDLANLQANADAARAISLNLRPVVVNGIPNQILTISGAPFIRNLAAAPVVFRDPDGDAMTYAARSSASNVATANISGSTLTVAAVAGGVATITVMAKDGRGRMDSTAFTVAINRAPVVANTIPRQTLMVGGAPFVRNLKIAPFVFTDPEGDTLAYSANSSVTAIATANIFNNTTLTVTPVAAGNAEITVMANDGKGGTGSTRFMMKINQAPSAPRLSSPSANTFVNNTTPELIFNVPADANNDLLHFKVEIDDDGNFAVVTQSHESKSGAIGFKPKPPVLQSSGQDTFTVQSALEDGDWWWRVSAWDSLTYGNASPPQKFIVDATTPFTSGHNPAKGATGVATNTNIVAHIRDVTSGVKKSSIVMKVQGSIVTPSIIGAASDYTLVYDPPFDFGFQQTITVSIEAADSAGNVMTTDSYSFTTVNQGNTAPLAPTLLPLSTNDFTQDNTPSLTFNIPPDANGDKLDFKIEIDDDGNFGDAGTKTFESTISTNGFSPTPPVPQGNGRVTYTVQSALAENDWWWRVSAWDGQLYGNASAARRFVIDQTRPEITPLTVVSSAPVGQNQKIQTNLTDNFGIQSALLYYRMGGASAYDSVAMSKISGPTYEGNIPGSAITNRGVEYHISVKDSAANRRTLPLTNPENKPQIIQSINSNLLFTRSTPAKAYRMISIPFDLNDKTVAGVLEDDLGKYDDTQWRLLRFVNGVNVEFGSPGFDAGLGFWLITRESKTLDAGDGKSITTAETYKITLPPGWSQIGNPFAFTVNWSDVIKGAEVENRLVGYQGALNEATGYDYTRTQVMPFEGYFVNNKGSSPTTIEIPPRAAIGSAAAKPAADWKSALQGNEWALQITATCDRYLDKDNYLGALNNASDEWDANDFSEAPFFDQHVALYFPHPEWKKYPDLYTGDFRETKAEGDYWDFVVRSEVAKSEVVRSEVVLRLVEVQNLPAEWEVILLDKASHVAINFSEVKQYAFPSGNGKTMREFRIVVGKKDFVETNDLNLSGVPQAFALGQNYPNPFNPQTRIDYELPVTSYVKISVYNLSGQFVRTLFEGEQSAGRYVVSWDGANANGERAASGVYLVRMEAGRFVNVRKMVLTR